MLDLNRLLSDVSGIESSNSKRSQHAELTRLLSEAFPDDSITVKGVEKWFERGSIPGDWLVKIQLLAERLGRPVQISDYV